MQNWGGHAVYLSTDASMRDERTPPTDLRFESGPPPAARRPVEPGRGMAYGMQNDKANEKGIVELLHSICMDAGKTKPTSHVFFM